MQKKLSGSRDMRFICAIFIIVAGFISRAAAEETLKVPRLLIQPQVPIADAAGGVTRQSLGFELPPWDLSDTVPAQGLNYPEGELPPREGYAASYTIPHATSVKNQMTCGTCWIFASLSSLEGKVNDDGGGASEPDYAEQNVKNCYQDNQGGNRCNTGGNAYYATSFLSYNGTVTELCDPYSTTQNSNCNTGCSVQVKPTQWRIISENTVASNDNIKYALTTYHSPVFVSMYATGGETFSHGAPALCGAASYTTHAVTIVGWDDSYPAQGSCSPGAWKVKNSWGTWWGDAGYFWVAYGQKNIGTAASVYSGYRSTYANEQVYHHDVGCAGYTFGWTNTNYGAVVHTAAAAGTIRRVEFMTNKANSDYEIRIFSTWNGTAAAPSGQLGATQTGSITHAGFYSIELEQPVTLSAGNTFVVQVKTYTAAGNGYGFYYDYYHRPGVSGVSFFSSNATSWYDSSIYSGGKGPVIIHAVMGDSQNTNTTTIDSSTTTTTSNPTLVLTKPNGGESWNRNSIRSITWSTSGSLGNLKLTLWQNGGLIGTIAENRDPAAGSYQWSAGAYTGGVAPLGTGYKIKIEEQNTGLSDESIGTFFIVKVKVNAPNGGESWQIGTTQNITWLTKIISNDLRIVLFKDGVKVGNIVDSIDYALGTYSWTAGNYIGGTAAAGTGYQIQVREIGTDTGDRSDANFTLTAP